MALRRNLHLWLIPVWILLGACGKSGSGIQEYAAPAGGPFSEEISALEAPERIDAALWEELKAALVLELARSGADKASAAPTAHPLSKVPDFRVSLGPSNSAIFEWSYRNHGDYDQNGEVNIADLTPVGQNFGAMIGDPGWAAAQVADGDGNGEVNIADISPIGQNFLASVEGYVLQTSQTPAQEASWQEVLSIPLGDGQVPAGGGFRQFTQTLGLAKNGNYYRVAPYQVSELVKATGIPSDFVMFSFVVHPQNLTATKGDLEVTVELTWGPLAGAQFYRVFRSDAVDGSYLEHADTDGPDVLYTDETVEDKVHYWYKVAGMLEAGLSGLSQAAEGWSNITPDPPTGLDASDGTNPDGISLSWTKSARADGYNVYRDDEANLIQELGDVDQWEDTGVFGSEVRTYWVSARNLIHESGLSDPDTGFRGTPPSVFNVGSDWDIEAMEATFSASLTGDQPMTFDWDFGGAALPDTSTDPEPVVTAGSEGTYEANLTVTNAAGSDAFAFPIRVSPDFTELLLVYNSDIPESEDLAAFYASPFTGRAIPADYVLGLPLGASDAAINRAAYNSTIRDPLKAHLDASTYKDTNKYILLVKGVPYQINNSGPSSVDSELCMLYEDGNYAYNGRLWSGLDYPVPPYWPYYDNSGFYEALGGVERSFEPFTYVAVDDENSQYTVSYLVGRISAYTYDETKDMIGRSLIANTQGNGWVIMDTHPGWAGNDTMSDPVWPWGDPDVDSLADLLTIAGYNNYLDYEYTVSLFDDLPPGAGNNVIAFTGWGVNHARNGGTQYPSGKMYILNDLGFTYLPGAAWIAYESFAARSFTWDGDTATHDGQGQVCDFIRMGGTVAAGNVYEPITDGIPDERRVMERYLLKGDRWIEACYKGMRYFSWRTIVLGDPLCRVVAE